MTQSNTITLIRCVLDGPAAVNIVWHERLDGSLLLEELILLKEPCDFKSKLQSPALIKVDHTSCHKSIN